MHDHSFSVAFSHLWHLTANRQTLHLRHGKNPWKILPKVGENHRISGKIMKNQEGWRKGCGEMRFPATAMQCLGAAFLEWQIHCRTTSSSHHFITKNLFRTPLQNLKFHCKTYQSKKAFAFHTNINFLGRNYNHLRYIYRSSPLLGSY